MKITVTTWYLEMTSPDELRPARQAGHSLNLHRVCPPLPVLNRFFYTAVGGHWYWVDRLGWTHARWMDYLNRDDLETWIGSLGGVPTGYYELERQDGGNVEIAYFGLLPEFTGQRLGGSLLTAAVRRAWAMGAVRVWVHTCSLDPPAARSNYLARGFRTYREEWTEKELPDTPPRPWPGAGIVRSGA